MRLIEEGAEEPAWWRRSGEEAEEEVEEEEEEEGEQQMRMKEWSSKSLEELYSVRHICRVLLHSSQGRVSLQARTHSLYMHTNCTNINTRLLYLPISSHVKPVSSVCS